MYGESKDAEVEVDSKEDASNEKSEEGKKYDGLNKREKVIVNPDM